MGFIQEYAREVFREVNKRSSKNKFETFLKEFNKLVKEYESNNVDGKYCLFCNHSMSSDAPDGSQVLVCFECDGFEGKEIIVGDDECCKNYSN